jgi:hypothetical protein
MGHQASVCDSKRTPLVQGVYVAPVVALSVPVEAVRRPVLGLLQAFESPY